VIDTLEEFCQEYFDVMGCLVEHNTDSIYEIILTDEVAPFFKQHSYLKISFTPELAKENSEVELLTYGSPILSGMIESAVHLGRTTRDFAVGLSLKKADITSRILQEYHLRPDEMKFSAPISAMAGYLLFNYKISYLSDEKRDYIYSAAVDLFSGAINDDLCNKQNYFFLQDTPDIDLPYHIKVDPRAAHQIAYRCLAAKVKQALYDLSERAKHKKMREIERVNKFFEQSIGELNARSEKLAPQDPRQAILAQKIENMKIDHRRKIFDLEKKYTHRIKGKLIAARLLIQPKIYYQFEISLPYVTAQGYFSWDTALKRIEPPACYICHQPVQKISVCANGHIVCLSCAIYCTRCKRIWCHQCGIQKCSVCGQDFCPECMVKCSHCQAVLCRKHSQSCLHNRRPPKTTAGEEFPHIEFSADSFEVLDKIEKNDFALPAKFMLSLKAQELSLIEGFDKILCLETVHNIKHFDYQIETVRKTLRDFSGRALLCDEVGLGKTIEAGFVLKEYILRGLVKRVLVLVPPSLIDQWHGELLDKFGLDFNSTEDYDFSKDSQLFWENNPWIIASLHTAKREAHSRIILKQHFDLVIVDEAHHLKSRQTQAWKFVNGLNKRFILLLTATPIQNSLEELFNLITLLKPGQLSTYRQFKREFGVRGDKMVVRNSDKLRQRLSEVMIRNSRSEVSIKLPPRRAETQRIELYAEEMDAYQEVTAFVRKYQPVVKASERGVTHFLLQLLQMEAGSSPFSLRRTIEKMLENPVNYPDAISRLKELLNMVDRVKKTAKTHALLTWLTSQKDSVLIFTNFLETQRFISKLLRENGFKVWDYHGGLSNAQKEETIANFRNEGGALISTEVGGEGKNFQFCQHLVNFDLPWNPMRIEQRVGRIHRIGQEKPVDILNFSARGTIESYILKILDEKINMFELVIGEMDMILGNLDEEREFENIVMEIWSGAKNNQDAEQKFEHLGEKLLNAKRQYLKQKRLDEDLFDVDFGI